MQGLESWNQFLKTSNYPKTCHTNFPGAQNVSFSTLNSLCEVAQSCPTLCDPMKPTRLLRPWDFPGKSTGVRWHCLLWLLTLDMPYRASLVAQRVKHLPAMQETRVWSLGWEDPLEESVAIHSNILFWRIPWTEEPGRVQSIGSHRVKHNWSNLAQHSRELICKVSGIQWNDETDDFSMW